MPYRMVVAKELADFLAAIAHPARLRIIEELRAGERDVHSLSAAAAISPSATSQHLMVLRAHRVVTERREGRRVWYQLRNKELANWLIQGLHFLPEAGEELNQVREAIRTLCAARDDESERKPNP